MRLGTCIALELAVAVGAVGGVWFGVGRAADLAGDYLITPDAAAATTIPTPLPRAELEVSHVPAPLQNVFGAPDTELLAPLGITPVKRIKMNRGGTSLSIRVDFANGARAAFKPEQTFPQSDPRREIAAYRIDRMLGIGRVPPAKPVALPVLEMLAAVDPGNRAYVMRRFEDAIARDGVLYGELSWWVPEITRAKLGKILIDEHEGRALWTSYLQIGASIPAAERSMVEQIAALVLFDVLIDNADRWSGNNTVMSPDGKRLFFMDNTLAFSVYRLGHPIPNAALRRISVFPRGLVARMRTLTLESVEEALKIGDETRLGTLLQPPEVRAIIARRDNILQHIDGLIAEFGEDAVLALP